MEETLTTILAAEPLPLVDGVIATIAYFLVAMVLQVLGFVIQDLLTPGKLRDLVFLDHLPNAGVLAASQAIALAIIMVTVVATSSDTLSTGLIHMVVYGGLGLILQSLFLVFLELVIPGRFRDLVEDPKLRSSAVVAGIMLIVVGAINAVSLT